MSSRDSSTRAFWDSHAKEFDAIYTHQKSALGRTLDSIYRRDMYDRFRFTMENSEPIQGRSFLDVGCGSGYYAVELARRGARSVTGVDFSENMLELARKRATEHQVAGPCRFVRADVLHWQPETRFDVSLVIGVMDYLPEPGALLRRVRQWTSDRAILSFPRLWTWRAPVRRVRLRLEGTPVFFYSKTRVEQLLAAAGFCDWKVRRVGKLYCVVARCDRESLQPADR